MRGTGHAAVVVHRKCPVTKQMQQDRLALRVKDADYNENKIKRTKQSQWAYQKS